MPCDADGGVDDADVTLPLPLVYHQMLRVKHAPLGRGGSLFFWSPTMNLGRDPRQVAAFLSAAPPHQL